LLKLNNNCVSLSGSSLKPNFKFSSAILEILLPAERVHCEWLLTCQIWSSFHYLNDIDLTPASQRPPIARSQMSFTSWIENPNETFLQSRSSRDITLADVGQIKDEN